VNKQQAVSTDVVTQNEQSVKSYFNNNLVNELDYTDESLNIIVNKEEDGSIGIYAYSNLQGYLTKGTSLGKNLIKALQIENDLRNYAISIGADALYNQTGQIDPRYLSFEENYINNTPELNLNQNSQTTQSAILGGFWFDDVKPWSIPRTAYPSVSATMWLGAWQKRVGSYNPLFFYGIDRIFALPFFKKRLATLTNWNSGISFDTRGLEFLNNKSRSWLAMGI
jgi:hypothetical protein